jgi:conjugal transfer/type IV secretion protein DotA/TraY
MKHRSRYIKWASLAALLLFPLIGSAQSTATGISQLQLQSTDKSWTVFFSWLTGSSDPSTWSMSSSPLAAVLGAFNGAVLMVGGLLAAYTIFAGILNTAHEGEILGKRWSTAYLPLRIRLGSAVLLPVQNGVCLMQLIVVWIAMMGSALGNNVWSAFTLETAFAL